MSSVACHSGQLRRPSRKGAGFTACFTSPEVKKTSLRRNAVCSWTVERWGAGPRPVHCRPVHAGWSAIELQRSRIFLRGSLFSFCVLFQSQIL